MPESQRWGGFRGDFLIANDPPRVAVEAGRVLGGTWLYLGNWMGQFGHWITETLPNAWSLPGMRGDLRGIIAHPFIFDNHVKEWQRQLLNDAGASGLDILIDSASAFRVERLVVPTRPVVLNAFAMPEAVEVWERVAQAGAARSPHRRVFLSVSAWRESQGRTIPGRTFANQRETDEVFRNAGFHVVSPETLTVREQVALARDAEILAGWSGSALHLSAFAGSDTRILELGDVRSGAAPVPQQRVLTAVRRQPHGFIPVMQMPGDAAAYDVSRLAALVSDLSV
ncbi:glycosyltransferase family 61 protein [Microbacterium sp. JZ31]|uniref:glycosyltransferase family 61 protein n=1 Tax=Microbacterium sp. JZ31 TaxID=1906274 RepID=UPI001EE3D98A|nr:glycosyltransferase 61 family protein [Microbacterium sp. JZ31]